MADGEFIFHTDMGSNVHVAGCTKEKVAEWGPITISHVKALAKRYGYTLCECVTNAQKEKV